jgi:hypothetical protein
MMPAMAGLLVVMIALWVSADRDLRVTRSWERLRQNIRRGALEHLHSDASPGRPQPGRVVFGHKSEIAFRRC